MRLHCELLDGGLFPQLGQRFMRRWHLTFVENPHASGHVITNARGEILAFILGTTDQARYVSETLRSAAWPLAVHGALGLARRPRLALTFLRTRTSRYARRILSSSRPAAARASNSLEPVAVVHAIVTTPAARGAGLGRQLIDRFQSDVAASGTGRIELLTAEARGAAEFYRRLGWSEQGVRTNRDRRRLILFRKSVRG